MNYKLISKTTSEENICQKVIIDGFDYYVSEEKLQVGDYLQRNNDLPVLYTENFWFDFGVPYKKAIATNNPSIDIPKVVDEVEAICIKDLQDFYGSDIQLTSEGEKYLSGFKTGYNKSQETHPFSEEDMIEFSDWCNNVQQPYLRNGYQDLDKKTLLQLWKEQRSKIVYYE